MKILDKTVILGRLGILLLVLAMVSGARAQELLCDVSTTNTEQLNSQARDNLSDFAANIKQYLNSQKWTKVDLGGYKVKCSLQVAFTTSPYANHYTAQVFVGSQRPINRAAKNTVVIRFLDNNWEFDYTRGQTINRDDLRFDALASFLDFYAYVILGFDFDTYREFDGTPYFQKAADITTRGRNSSVAAGWQASQQGVSSRGELIDELMNSQYQDFRIAIYKYHYRGLDWLDQKPDDGKKNILASLKRIANLQKNLNQKSLLISLFFETKYEEIESVFKNYTAESDIYEQLGQIDPSHIQKYLDYEKSQ
jgi:hypothetical protein